jgi:hypothetical protein
MTEEEHPEPVELETIEEEVAEEPQPKQIPITREQMALLVSKMKRKIIKEEQREKRVSKDRKKKALLKKQRKHAKNRGR